MLARYRSLDDRQQFDNSATSKQAIHLLVEIRVSSSVERTLVGSFSDLRDYV